MATQKERTDATRHRIIEAATRIFAQMGYRDAALGNIVTEANVTTGALYHHFRDKKGLFLAVAETLEQLIVDEAVSQTADLESPWEVFETGVLTTLEICARPDIQRIVFKEAPSVIGLAEWREVELRYALGLMIGMVRNLHELEILDAPAPELTAQILLGAIIEGSHGVAISNNKKQALKQCQHTIGLMLVALRRK